MRACVEPSATEPSAWSFVEAFLPAILLSNNTPTTRDHPIDSREVVNDSGLSLTALLESAPSAPLRPADNQISSLCFVKDPYALPIWMVMKCAPPKRPSNLVAQRLMASKQPHTFDAPARTDVYASHEMDASNGMSIQQESKAARQGYRARPAESWPYKVQPPQPKASRSDTSRGGAGIDGRHLAAEQLAAHPSLAASSTQRATLRMHPYGRPTCRPMATSVTVEGRIPATQLGQPLHPQQVLVSSGLGANATESRAERLSASHATGGDVLAVARVNFPSSKFGEYLRQPEGVLNLCPTSHSSSLPADRLMVESLVQGQAPEFTGRIIAGKRTCLPNNNGDNMQNDYEAGDTFDDDLQTLLYKLRLRDRNLSDTANHLQNEELSNFLKSLRDNFERQNSLHKVDDRSQEIEQSNFTTRDSLDYSRLFDNNVAFQNYYCDQLLKKPESLFYVFNLTFDLHSGDFSEDALREIQEYFFTQDIISYFARVLLKTAIATFRPQSGDDYIKLFKDLDEAMEAIRIGTRNLPNAPKLIGVPIQADTDWNGLDLPSTAQANMRL